MSADPQFSAYAETARPHTILVVEDEPLILLLTADYLRGCDLHVLEAASADQAKDLLQSGVSIDVVFTDMQMPGQMDGFDLALWLHDRRPDIEILVTSGTAEKTDIAERLLCDRASVFAKPYVESAVQERIQALLN